MMAPIVLGKNEQSAILKAIEANSNYVGLVLIRSDEESPGSSIDLPTAPKSFELHKIGVIVKVMQVTSPPEGRYVHLICRDYDGVPCILWRRTYYQKCGNDRGTNPDGLVMPIGGLKEKVITAKRLKMSILVFPKENQSDFDELDDHIKEGITTV